MTLILTRPGMLVTLANSAPLRKSRWRKYYSVGGYYYYSTGS